MWKQCVLNGKRIKNNNNIRSIKVLQNDM